MVNEIYKIMDTIHYIASMGYHSGSILIIMPSDSGKSDRVSIFSELHVGTWIIPCSSETELGTKFSNRKNTITFIMDEPSDWTITDYTKSAMMLKHILEGVIQPARNTMFKDGTPIPKYVHSGVIILCNNPQYNKIRNPLDGCGLLERTVILRAYQNSDTRNRVSDFYEKGCYNRLNLPEFKIDFEYLTIPKEKIPDRTLNWINTYFEGYRAKTVRWIYKVVPDKIFEQFKPFLISDFEGKFSCEEIELTEPDKIKEENI